MSAMPKTRPPYPPEFRREAVQLVRFGRCVKDVGDSLGCSDQSLHNWVKQEQLDRHERNDGRANARSLTPGRARSSSLEKDVE